jgi:hypothetical protein
VTLPFFTPEPPELGRRLCVLLDARGRNTIAASTDPKQPIPACIVRGGETEHNESRIQRIFP